ncbi:MAG: hypothetical protein ABIP93_02480 [Gemmatimonadaceae bacterium]
MESEALVRLTISGLCMFVPDPKKDRVLVLMPRIDGDKGKPASEGHGSHDAHSGHFARIVYDLRHDPTTPDSESEASVDPRYRSVNIDRRKIMVAKGDLQLDASLDAGQMLKLDYRVCFNGVATEYDEGPGTGKPLMARLALRSGKATAYHHGGADGSPLPPGTGTPAQFTIGHPEQCKLPEDAPNRTQPMAYAVQWDLGTFKGGVTLGRLFPGTLMGGPAASPRLRKSEVAFDDEAEKELRPICGVINLKLMHVVDDELPDDGGAMKPPQGFGIEHFDAYYEMAQDPRKGPKPQPPKDRFFVGTTCAPTIGEFI